MALTRRLGIHPREGVAEDGQRNCDFDAKGGYVSARIALIGIGHIAEYQLQALSKSPHWIIVGATDLRSERQHLLPPGIPFFSSPEELLNTVNADMVLVSTPNCTHYELGKLVLSKGKNLLLEKPCCETQEQLDDLVQLSIQKGTLFSVALHAAHARDLNWFLTNQHLLGLGNLTSFNCCFFDPYIENQHLMPSATSLGGSWFDSGINALSVIASIVPANRIYVEDARFTRIHIDGCTDPQAVVDFQFNSNDFHGRGTIETNWALGINRKITRLVFAQTGREVLLDHSNERVDVMDAGELIQSVDLKTAFPRLVNHYEGVFADAYDSLCNKRSNLEFAVAIHQLLFSASRLK